MLSLRYRNSTNSTWKNFQPFTGAKQSRFRVVHSTTSGFGSFWVVPQWNVSCFQDHEAQERKSGREQFFNICVPKLGTLTTADSSSSSVSSSRAAFVASSPGADKEDKEEHSEDKVDGAGLWHALSCVSVCDAPACCASHTYE